MSTLLVLCSSAGTLRLRAQQPKPPQKLDSIDLERGHAMLRQIHDDIRKNYYDPTFHGIDIDATYKQFDERMNASQTVNDSFHVIAAFVMQFHDSHTFFSPPARTNHSTFGYTMEMIGDKCFITHIRPNTDAAKKLHIGDQVLALNNFGVKRASFWDMTYFFHTLSPAPSEILDLQNPAGEHRKETLQALLIPGKSILDLTEDTGDLHQIIRENADYDQLNRQRYIVKGDVFLWKMPSFEVDTKDIDTMFTKVGSHQTLILDLRDNPGGYVDTLKWTLAHLVDHDLTLASEVSRKETKPIPVKTRGASMYHGKVIVLIDSQSASAAELLPRVLQLEKRVTILGDTSAGAVMEARYHPEQLGTDYVINYGLSVTYANLLMADGKSLENVGVTPDELVLPTGQDLADAKDPVLARALEIAGVPTDPSAAGKLFPFEWPPL